MKSAFKLSVCKFFLVLTALFCLLMGTFVLEGSLALLPALSYSALALLGADLLCRLLLPAEQPSPTPAREPAAGPAAVRRTYAPGQVPIRVVPGGKAA